MRYAIDRVFLSVQFTTQSFYEFITVVVGKFKSFVNIVSCVTCFQQNKRNSWLAIRRTQFQCIFEIPTAMICYQYVTCRREGQCHHFFCPFVTLSSCSIEGSQRVPYLPVIFYRQTIFQFPRSQKMGPIPTTSYLSQLSFNCDVTHFFRY